MRCCRVLPWTGHEAQCGALDAEDLAATQMSISGEAALQATGMGYSFFYSAMMDVGARAFQAQGGKRFPSAETLREGKLLFAHHRRRAVTA